MAFDKICVSSIFSPVLNAGTVVVVVVSRIVDVMGVIVVGSVVMVVGGA